jgi:hypothetical protein
MDPLLGAEKTYTLFIPKKIVGIAAAYELLLVTEPTYEQAMAADLIVENDHVEGTSRVVRNKWGAEGEDAPGIASIVKKVQPVLKVVKPSSRGGAGSKYEETKDLDIAEVAKLVRKDLAALKLPVKPSVRISRYSGGQSLDVHLKMERDPELAKKIRAILNSYNFDESDSQSDYFCVRFYGHVTFNDGALA